MAWFASKLKTECADDLLANNAYAVNTLIGNPFFPFLSNPNSSFFPGLQAYSIVYTVGCLSDSTTNSYCYLSAVHNPNPSDLYFYGLPLGMPLPPKSVPVCSLCTGSTMQHYAAALQDPSQTSILVGLHQTYEAAAALADKQCGAAYAQAGVVATATAGASVRMAEKTTGLVAVAAVLVVWTVIS